MDRTYIPRCAEAEIRDFIADETPNKNVLLVEGARQVGKSFLVQHVLGTCGKKTVIVKLERDTRLLSLMDECEEFGAFQQCLRDRLGFDGSAGQVLFIDEAQESRRLGRFVRFMKEDWPHASVILSGSTLARLFRADTRFPVGRIRQMALWPFSFCEFLSALAKDDLADEIRQRPTAISDQRHGYLLELYDRFLVTGGLPQVVMAAAQGGDHEHILAQIIADYERDFIRIFGETDVGIVQACFKSVANFVGSPFKNTTVVPAPGNRINERINEILARLESWHLVIRSDQRGMGAEASQGYHPKRYLFDTGILRRFRESAWPSIRILKTLSPALRVPLGGVLENQTAIDLSRFMDRVCGWKKASSGHEVDFVVKQGSASCPVECKAALRLTGQHTRGIRDYLELYGQNTGAIVSLAPYQEVELAPGRRIISVPAYLLERLPELI